MSPDRLARLVAALPKTELHLHIEGTLEPELMFELARRNGVPLRHPSVEAVRAAYQFGDLQSFLDLYYEGAVVLLRERDFHDLAAAYLARAAADDIRHVEIFFDPQTHTDRGVPLATVMAGLGAALDGAARETGLTHRLILCFLRHLPAEAAMATFEAARPWIERGAIHGVGLDSSERGHPPSKFQAVFDRARAAGLRAVAHAGEEGPPAYIREALDLLHVERIDHGVRCEEDPALVEELVRRRVPLTVCPLSNVKLRVVRALAEHNLARLLRRGLCVTVNSDDPAYFGGYLGENLRATAAALDLTAAEVVKLVENGWEASFLPAPEREAWRAEVRRIGAALGS